MATDRATINLSELPVPDAVVLPDPDRFFAGWLAKLRELDPVFDALLPSDPVYKQGEVLAYHTTLVRQAMNDAIRAVLLASSQGHDLDQLGANFEVARLVIRPGLPDAVPPVLPVLEDDTAFRARIQLAWSRLSTAGAENAYHFFAASASADVLDVHAYGPEDHGLPGHVWLYVLSRIGEGKPTQALLDTVLAAVNKKDVQPLTDYVTVKPAEVVGFEVHADIVLPYGPDTDTVMRAAETALKAYLAKAHRIGKLVSCSAIDRALHQPGVRTVHLHQPADDVAMAMGQVGYCRKITLNKVVADAD